jgi:hypothetical protein
MISEITELSAYVFSDRVINVGIMFLLILIALIVSRYLRDTQMPFNTEDVVESFRVLGLAVRRLTTSWSAQEGMTREAEVAISDSPIRTREARDAEAIANAQEDRAAVTRIWLERRQEIENQRDRLTRSLRVYQRIGETTTSRRHIEWANLKILETLLQISNLSNDTITVTTTGPPPEMQEAISVEMLRAAAARSNIRPEEDHPKEEPRPSRMIRAKDQSNFLADKEDGVDDA